MREDLLVALSKGNSSDMAERTIDITTFGRRSGQPRRIEICFYRVDETTYLSGIPRPRPRDWLLNLADNPEFIFHFKHGVIADVPAVATVITNAEERRRVLKNIVDEFNAHHGPANHQPSAVLDEWVQYSPLAKVAFLENS